MTNLRYLVLPGNQLTGEIPSTISNLINLEILHLSYNQLSGIIPNGICDLNINWDSWQAFDIDENQLCPPYPSCISQDDIDSQDTSNCP